MVALGLEVVVEPGAGAHSFISDAEYEAAGATVQAPREAWASADVLLKVRGPTVSEELGVDEIDLIKPGAVVIGFLDPYRPERWKQYAEGRITAVAMELVPRITRAQKMDALSSQASIAGYKAVLMAASELPRYFPLLMTAAGTVKPARVVVLGAGVAGLQAIATARRLGAVVEASDVRPAVKEQVQSLGARFIEPPELDAAGEDKGGYARDLGADFAKRQQQVLTEHIMAADVVITTALIPGKPAPRLITEEAVTRMRQGSVIVDLAAEQGGNCELTEAGKSVRKHGVLLLGHTNLPSTMPADASALYARNVFALLAEMVKEGQLVIDADDELFQGPVLTRDGQIVKSPLADRLGLTTAAVEPQAKEVQA